MPLPLLIPIVEAAAEFAWGAHQKSQSDSELNGLGKSPNYSISPESQDYYNRALEMSRQGYSPAETGAFRQKVAQDINTKSRNATDIGGGNAARTISKIGAIDEIGAENQFAAGDAKIHRDNIAKADQSARFIQGQKNLATGASIRDYDSQRSYLQKSGAQGVQNMFGGLDLAAMGVGRSLQTPDHLSDASMYANGMDPSYRAPMRQASPNLQPSDQYNSGYWDDFSSYGQQPVNPYTHR